MKVGDLVKFKKNGKVGTIVSVVTGTYWTEVQVLHTVEGVPNPAGFTMASLLDSAEVISESR